MYCESLFTGPKINFTFQKKPYPAYIISSKDDRFNFTQTNLNKALPNYFDIKRKYSVLHNDTRISRFGLPQVSSLLLTYIDLWSEIGKTPKRQLEDNDWVFIFEDDVNILVSEIIQQFHTELFNRWNHTDDQHSLRGLINQGLKLAQDDGILYLGTCGPEYVGNESTIEYSKDGLFPFFRGVYYCTHAVAYTKWRSRRMWGDLASYMFLHGDDGSDTMARQWQARTKTFPRSVAGNIEWPPGDGHYGFFFQDRFHIRSTIQ